MSTRCGTLVTNVEQVPGYRYIPVEQVQMVLAVPEDSPLLEGCAVRADSPWPVIGKEWLEGIPMVSMPRSTNSGRLARELCGSFGIHPNMVLEVSDVRTLIDAVEQGYGAAMLISAHEFVFLMRGFVIVNLTNDQEGLRWQNRICFRWIRKH